MRHAVKLPMADLLPAKKLQVLSRLSPIIWVEAVVDVPCNLPFPPNSKFEEKIFLMLCMD